jgi:predicted kinase
MTEKTNMLIATRGLPGSGKSTWARTYAAAEHIRTGRPVPVFSRDAFRDLIGVNQHGDHHGERAVTAAIEAAVTASLRQGLDVIVDAVHLRSPLLRSWVDLAANLGVQFRVQDFTDVPLDECLRRNALRPARVPGRCDGAAVPEDVIRTLHHKFLRGRTLPLPVPETTPGKTFTVAAAYVPPDGKPEAIMVDIDGTVADLNGRDPYDVTTVSADLPNQPVIDVVRAMLDQGFDVVFMSGRPDRCYDDTRQWLAQHVLPDWYHTKFDWPLFMRKSGDTRQDATVKLELFDQHVRHNYRIRFVLDDRDQVVRAWRLIGLPVFQVAEGNF